jgi:radical SAM protein with 4Fe4S-binding SPASM domain
MGSSRALRNLQLVQNGKGSLVNMITFITPTYNHRRYIQRCIKSVMGQTVPCKQIIIDDGSTDGTSEIAAAYVTNNIRFVKQEHKGISRLAETYNKALSMVETDNIAILEGDDYSHPYRAELSDKALKIKPFAFGYIKKKDDRGSFLGYFDAYANDIDFIQFDVVSRPDYSPSDPVCLKHSKEFAAKLDAVAIEASKHKIKVLNCTQVNSNNLERGKPMSFMLEEATNWRSCPLSWYSMFVEPNGDAYFCYNYGYVLGNVFTESPLKVWNSAKARAFRKQLQTKEPPVRQCRICNFARLGTSNLKVI